MIAFSLPALVRGSRGVLFWVTLIAALFAVMEAPRWAAAVSIAPILGA